MKSLSLKYLVIVFLTAELSYSQNTAPASGDKIKNNTRIENLKDYLSSNSKLSKSLREKEIETQRIESLEFRYYKTVKPEKFSFDLISTVGSNISFGGFWEKYAVINFTPQMFIKPVSFISIYANHNLNCLVPLEGVKEYSRSIVLQSLTILAVDNSIKFIMNNKVNWITDVISFAAKNLLISFLIKPALAQSSNSSDPIIQFDNFYYSMSITF